jgi:hypothetical protein
MTIRVLWQGFGSDFGLDVVSEAEAQRLGLVVGVCQDICLFA